MNRWYFRYVYGNHDALNGLLPHCKLEGELADGEFWLRTNRSQKRGSLIVIGTERQAWTYQGRPFRSVIRRGFRTLTREHPPKLITDRLCLVWTTLDDLYPDGPLDLAAVSGGLSEAELTAGWVWAYIAEVVRQPISRQRSKEINGEMLRWLGTKQDRGLPRT